MKGRPKLQLRYLWENAPREEFTDMEKAMIRNMIGRKKPLRGRCKALAWRLLLKYERFLPDDL
jgi:hypothetical protein